jgi:lipoprotein NlpD
VIVAFALLCLQACRTGRGESVWNTHAEPELVKGSDYEPPVEMPVVPIASESTDAESAPLPSKLTHQVGPGENLFRIAMKYDVTVDELKAANDITDVRQLAAGQTLVIPRKEGAGSPRAPRSAQIASLKPLPVRLQLEKSNDALNWPLHGVIYARFGKKGREPHDGIDLAAPEGTPVKTAAPGRVIYAGEQKAYGLIVIVEHSEESLITLYAHNRDLRVTTGQKVREGQVIATVGQSGRTSGPHLHFEVRREGKPVDPLGYLKKSLPRQGRAP